MTKPKNEFLALLCNLYMSALLAALPLYTGEGYWQLGRTKYMLFRNLSLLCLGLWLSVGTAERLWLAAGKMIRKRRDGSAERPQAANEPVEAGRGRRFSQVDCLVAAYAVWVVLSALCSPWGALAWRGYEGWYMGAASQLLFAGIYFFVSRRYDGACYPLCGGEAALALATLLGLLHRLGLDPLGLLAAYNKGDWEYSHMMSTLGNINWLCGFYSVALALSMAHYLREKRRPVSLALYLENVAAFLLLMIQGSYSGLLIPAVCTGVSLLFCRRDAGAASRALAVPAAAFFLMPVWERLMRLMGGNAILAADGNIFAVTVWYGWWILAGICLLGSLCLLRLSEKAAERLIFLTVCLGVACAVAGMLFFLRRAGLDDGFGSGRGFLWRISAESFEKADWKTKLLGAGPDCFGEAVFQNYADQAGSVWEGTYWENAVFTNAHSEPLTQLLNLGAPGALLYLGIFGAGLYRYRRQAAGALALAMYGTYALVSFQQVLSTPLLFLVLGVCESRARGDGSAEA